MRIFCYIGIHQFKRMPWMQTRDGSPKPDSACMRCGKIRYDWIIYIHSAEGRLFNYKFPQYEGQPPPKGYGSWKEYQTAQEEAVNKWLKRTK